jgi:glycine betaine/proline transport system substrate-binding protein
MNGKRRLVTGAMVLALALGLAACGSDDNDSGASPETTAAGSGAKSFEGTITLAVNPWDGSAANANVAKIVLEKQGMTVNLKDIDENAVWPALDSGSIDANLEVWPSGHAKDFDNYITQKKSVVDGGLLGVNLGQFLLGDPSYVSYDADIIKNLDLPFKVVVGGSEATLITQLDNAIKDQTPLLFYFYNPQWKWADPAFADAVQQVELPEVTDECTQSAEGQGEDGKYACAYPPDELYKAISAKLESKNPAAFGFLQKFELTDTDQNTITSYKNVDDMTIEEAAQKWVDENESTWQEWLT